MVEECKNIGVIPFEIRARCFTLVYPNHSFNAGEATGAYPGGGDIGGNVLSPSVRYLNRRTQKGGKKNVCVL